MKNLELLLRILVSLLFTQTSFAASHIRRRLAQQTSCTLLHKITQWENSMETHDVACEFSEEDKHSHGYDSQISGIVRITGGSDGLKDSFIDGFLTGRWKSGESTIMVEGAVFSSDGNELLLPSDITVESNKIKFGISDIKRVQGLQSTGNKSVLALRVAASGGSEKCTRSVNRISDDIFGTGNDPVNMKSQFSACSYDKLSFEPASGNNISNGVGEVTVGTKATSNNIENAVLNAGNNKYGSMKDKFDYVMVCIPDKKGSWVAYAYINSYLSVYRDNWCNMVSSQMHELGHNLGLGHANENGVYKDQTGLMGYSYKYDNWPLMCFNAPNNYQLGWYDDKAITVESEWNGRLYGISDYNEVTANPVFIRVQGSNEDYYISFNRESGINADTVEGENQVLVHSRSPGTGYAETKLLAKLSEGSTYVSTPLPITVTSINLNANPAYAEVSIGGTGGGGCTDISQKRTCNLTLGCGYNVFESECRTALDDSQCLQFEGKKSKCKKNGCKWKNSQSKCKGRWA